MTVRQAARAYEAFWRNPDSLYAWLTFVRHHAALRERYCQTRLWNVYRARLRRAGIDPTVIFERGGVTFRRV